MSRLVFSRKGWQRALAVAALVLVSGCATTTPASGPGAAAPVATPDPWENWNRKVFAFNEKLDTAVLKPVAEGYRKVVPEKVRTGINNVLSNIYDVWSAANQLLQGKLQYGLEMGMRVVANTTFGLGGLLDPATEMGLVRRSEDFGQTLGRWGLATGPYVVLPVLGPSSVRDTGGLVVDRVVPVAPSKLPDATAAQYGVVGVEVVNTRSNLLDAGNLVDQVALDKYSFVRDAYIARRLDAVYDGAPPMDTFNDDGADPVAKPAGSAASAPARAASSAAGSGATAAPPSLATPAAAAAASAPRK